MMNTVREDNTLAGYVEGSAGQLRVAVRTDHYGRVITFLKEGQELNENGPWNYTLAYLLNASRKGRGLLLEPAAPLWGYPEWSLTAGELARAVYAAVETFAQLEDR